jgi:diguanylate cyclase (GGDEF)-like protein
MTAGTKITNSHQMRFAGLPTRSRTRATVALVVLVIVGAGLWGALSTVEGLRTYERAKRLESGLEQARYALALERGAASEAQPARARGEFRSGDATFSAALRLVRTSGGSGPALAGAIRAPHARFRAAAGDLLSARIAGDLFAITSGRRAVETRANRLDGLLARDLAAIRGGAANVWPSRPIQKFELAATAVLVALGVASAAFVLLRLIGYRRRLERARREELVRLEEAASTDNLTGLGNRRAFYDDLKREIARRSRSGSVFSLVMLDLDRLKEINDTLGHPAGDERIRAVAVCLQATVRGSDRAYRTGGDEFMALLPGERAWGAFTFSQRLQAEVAKLRIPLSVSCGVVESVGLETAEQLVHRADLALYDAKRSGRRIVIYSDGLENRSERAEDRASRRHHRLLATALAHAVDAKDSATRNHCETVSTLCVLMGQALGLEGERLEQLQLAGLLHDVGKIGVADALLQKPEALDDDEQTTMSSHVQVGHAIVSAAGLPTEAGWVLHHHEHFDGRGYPDGLAGEEIALESRIILVADAFEAMTAERPYRRARSPEEAFRELERGSGTQFDPTCIAALRTALAPQYTTLPAGRGGTVSAPVESPPNTAPQAASA